MHIEIEKLSETIPFGHTASIAGVTVSLRSPLGIPEPMRTHQEHDIKAMRAYAPALLQTDWATAERLISMIGDAQVVLLVQSYTVLAAEWMMAAARAVQAVASREYGRLAAHKQHEATRDVKPMTIDTSKLVRFADQPAVSPASTSKAAEPPDPLGIHPVRIDAASKSDRSGVEVPSITDQEDGA